ncbi:hypothetical protein GCM10009738_15880 [Kitasatospora viridis]|uniref:Uncharacterized protein n=1 Tax=Kitasatospora viridis TaxID=281105 RepID=A0A561T601_9ACTN|nr:hypothetical protein FHX73_141 [Kitasatospora viridis]
MLHAARRRISSEPSLKDLLLLVLAGVAAGAGSPDLLDAIARLVVVVVVLGIVIIRYLIAPQHR